VGNIGERFMVMLEIKLVFGKVILLKCVNIGIVFIFEILLFLTFLCLDKMRIKHPFCLLNLLVCLVK